MHEQFRALWKSRDKAQSFVGGRLLTRTSSKGCVNGYKEESNLLTEKWFTLIGHALFFSKSKESEEYSGVYLTDLFAPVVARVDQKTLEEFDVPLEQQVCIIIYNTY